ncbi:MAG: cytidine deaminase [Lachnospiraceae bacterium]|nr:cytidine deaminase [Lachnospiraceae bacterium]
MNQAIIALLVKEAKKARRQAYAPYSHFQVGAALLCSDGNIFSGCNIENASYPAGNCAERTAVFKAVSAGRKDFRAIAIAGGKEEGALELCPPCGICRQVLAEFCEKDFQIILVTDDEHYQTYPLEQLLPLSFHLF